MGMLQEIGPSPIRLALLEDRTNAGSALFAGVDTTAPRAGTVEAADLEPYRATVELGRRGIVVDAIASDSRVVAGQRFRVDLSLWNTGTDSVAARLGLDLPVGWTVSGACLGSELQVAPRAVGTCHAEIAVPADAPVTVPYFLREPRVGALYRWTGDHAVWGEPFDPPLVTARFALALSGRAPAVVSREVKFRLRDQAIGEVRRPLAVVPRVGVSVSPDIKVWPTSVKLPQWVTVTLEHAGPDSTVGTVHLDLPAGWPDVAPQPFRLTRPDEHRAFTFLVRPPPALAPGTYPVHASARVEGVRYETGMVTVNYPHIRERRFSRPSRMEIHAAAIALPKARRVGYVRGAADRVPEALAGVGLQVELLDPGYLERGDLARFDVIVIGSRAYETDPVLIENNGRLLDYVRDGGRVVVQYQQGPYFAGNFAPYDLTVGQPHDRVTDERAPVRELRPDDPAFRSPNPIGAADWDGWIQERGLYFAHTWDRRYVPLVESHDANGPPLEGGLLIAPYGKGTYLYSGLAFFRQLPAGVVGAFRLFFNLLDASARAAVP
jgi:hypothetical protein